MKNVVRALICISISLVALNCTNDESMPAQGKVQFALAITSSSADGGRILSQSFPAGSYISLSIETASSASVYSLKKVDLIKLGDGYLTAPLVLTEGSYRLTDFFVMSAGNEILYATPKEGSPLAGLVEHPLPMSFSVKADGISNLNIQVVDAEQQSPEDFGYVSFGVEVVGSDFSISLFIDENANLNFTSGTLHLYLGDELVHIQNLLAKVNPVNFKGDPNATYNLVVKKEGYTIKSKEYVLHDLISELNGNPLVLVLSPASTITLLVKESSPFGIHLTTGWDDIYVDWGDGTIERVMITSGYFTELIHEYPETGRYHINITGNLTSINEYYFTWVDDYEIGIKQTIESIDITRLTELRQYRSDWRTIPSEINFSHNTKLESLDVSYTNISNLDISHNPYLNFLKITSTSIVDYNNPNDLSKLVKIIDDLNQHVVDKNVHDGTFAYTAWDGILPNASKAKLMNIEENYGWFIWPPTE